MKIGPYFSGSNAAAVSLGQEAWRAVVNKWWEGIAV